MRSDGRHGERGACGPGAAVELILGQGHARQGVAGRELHGDRTCVPGVVGARLRRYRRLRVDAHLQGARRSPVAAAIEGADMEVPDAVGLAGVGDRGLEVGIGDRHLGARRLIEEVAEAADTGDVGRAPGERGIAVGIPGRGVGVRGRG